MNTSIKDVDTYLSKQPENIREALEKLRQLIKKIAPEAEEVISYGIPMYKYNGMLVGFAAFKDHLSFFPGGYPLEEFKAELKNFSTSKGTIRFTLEKPLPEAIIKKIVKAKMKRNSENAKKKNKFLIFKNKIPCKK